MEELSLKELKEIATSKGLTFAKNATKEQIVALLNGGEPVVDQAAEAKAKFDEVSTKANKKKEKFFLGNCVKTGEPLYKDI